MKRVKGIVLENNGKWAKLLTADAEFIKVPSKTGYLPGIEVEVAYPQLKSKNYLMSAIAAASIIFILSTILFFHTFLITQAYVALDINPSLLLYLNRRAEVIKIEGANKDGKLFLHNLDLKKKSIEEAISTILQKAYMEKYLSPQKENIIIISLASPEHYSLGSGELEASAGHKVAALGVDAYLKVNTIEREKVIEAKKKHVSVNTLLVIEEMEEKGFLEEKNLSEAIPPDASAGALLKNIEPALFFNEKEYIDGYKNDIKKTPPGLEKKSTKEESPSDEKQNLAVIGEPQKILKQEPSNNKKSETVILKEELDKFFNKNPAFLKGKNSSEKFEVNPEKEKRKEEKQEKKEKEQQNKGKGKAQKEKEKEKEKEKGKEKGKGKGKGKKKENENKNNLVEKIEGGGKKNLKLQSPAYK
ncbi:MAG: hypothetical protein GXZ07_07145 [Firmicutes bacterium]|nr:hypothetical protein [Bacillota bacterium]